MFSKEIEKLLQKSLKAAPVVVCNRSLRSDIDDLVAQTLPLMKLAVVDDKHTSGVLGDQVFRALSGLFSCTHIMLEGKPMADDKAASYLRGETSDCDALVAVGSGTINDLCKYVSHQDNKPYLVFPTAASMNGYLSANASITIEGYKKT